MARGTRRAGRRAIAAVIIIALSVLPVVLAAELPITKNPPISDFQNRPQDVTPYNFDAPPQGLFRTITTAEGFDEELGFHRTHEIVPVKPTDRSVCIDYADGWAMSSSSCSPKTPLTKEKPTARGAFSGGGFDFSVQTLV
jgi:hypothetical protein